MSSSEEKRQKLEGKKGTPQEGIRQRKSEGALSREEDKMLWRTRGVPPPTSAPPQPAGPGGVRWERKWEEEGRGKLKSL